MWLRASFITFIVSLIMFGLIWFYARFYSSSVPLEATVMFLLAPFVLSVFLLSINLYTSGISRPAWKWDEAGLVISNRRYPWSDFQCFRVYHDPLTPNFAFFGLQFHDTFMEKGVWWFGITAYTHEIETLAKFVGRHIPDLKATNPSQKRH